MSESAHPFARSSNRWRLGRWAGLVWLFLAFSVWSHIGAAAPALAQAGAEAPTYLIGPGDSLDITVWRQPELSTGVTVRPDGRISVPLVEDLLAAGKTPMALADEIEVRLSEYLQDPQVTVTVASGLGDPSQQVRVVGEAAEPTAIAYSSGMTLLDAVIAAGGLARGADGNASTIVRQKQGQSETIPVRLADLVRDGDSSANVPLQPGDVIIIPEGFIQGEWHVTYNASASQTFSDNIDQDPKGEREAGFVTRAGPGLTISGSSARVTAALSGDIAGVQQFGGDDAGFSIDPSIAATSNTEVVPDLLFFDLNASISRQLLDSRESTSASGASTSNRDLVATLTASPYLVHRLSNFANAEWRYRFSPVLVEESDNDDGDNEDANDVYSHDGSFILESGRDFSNFAWTWTNRVGEEVRSEESDIETALTDFAVTYPLWEGFSLIGAIGYEYRDGDEEEENNFDGVTWRAGFAYNPHPDLDVQATYGRRDDDDSLNASLEYRLGPKTSIIASYAEALQTPQQRAISNLGQLVFDPETGQLIDQRTGLPFTGDQDPFSFDDGTTRTKTFLLGARHDRGRDAFNLQGTAGTSEGESEGDEEFYEARFTWSRPLSSDLRFTSSAGYEHSIFDDEDRTDDTYTLNMGLSYQLATDAYASFNYFFQAQDSTDDDEQFYENAVTLGVVFSF